MNASRNCAGPQSIGRETQSAGVVFLPCLGNLTTKREGGPRVKFVFWVNGDYLWGDNGRRECGIVGWLPRDRSKRGSSHEERAMPGVPHCADSVRNEGARLGFLSHRLEWGWRVAKIPPLRSPTRSRNERGRKRRRAAPVGMTGFPFGAYLVAKTLWGAACCAPTKMGDGI